MKNSLKLKENLKTFFPCFFFFLGTFVALISYAQNRPSYPSFIEKLSIPNADYVDKNQKILRGMTPTSKGISELITKNVTDVLIFKKQTTNEIDKEISELKKQGFSSSNIHHIPILWRLFPSLNEACEQTLTALQLLISISQDEHRKIFFHCTAGEDRTGYLAGLFRLLTEEASLNDIYQNELCYHGFAEGDPYKPEEVSTAVNGDLKFLFFAIAHKIINKEITLSNIPLSSCKNLQDHFNKDKYSCDRSGIPLSF